MLSCLYVAAGGAVGSVLRYLIGLIDVSETTVFPIKTLIINIVGSFLISCTVAVAGSRLKMSPNMILFLKVGICGGFTTFSTFALETTDLIQNGRVLIAALYVGCSVLFSVLAVLLGQNLAR